MTVRISTGLQAVPIGVNGINPVFDSGAVDLYTGGQPADADDAPTGDLIVSIPLEADALSNPSAGNIAVAGVPIVEESVDAGTIGWGRIRTAGDGAGSSSTDPRIDFSVSLTGAGGDVQGDQVAFGSGEDVQLDALVLSWPRS